MAATKRIGEAMLVRMVLLLCWVLLLMLALTAGAIDPSKKSGPSTVEPIAGTKLNRITLTQKAVERLDIRTAKVNTDATGAIVAPYAAVLYDINGSAWVYTNPEPFVYVRHPIVISSISGLNATLKEGPSVGTLVVIVGAAELYGAENGIGH